MTRFGMVVTLSALISGVGCAARSDVRRADVEALRERVSELESDRRRRMKQYEILASRVDMLENRHSRQGSRKALPVVRVLPSKAPVGDGDEGQWAGPQASAPAPSPPAQEDDRPVLRLHQSRYVQPQPAARPRPRPSISLASVTERLPVVPLPDPPSHSAPTPSLPSGPTLPSAPTLPAGPQIPPPLPEQPAQVSIEGMYGAARNQVRAGQCGAAMPALTQIISQNPEHQLADDAMYLRGSCLRRQGQHLRAIGVIERLLRRYPGSNQAPEALYTMAESYAALGDTQRAGQIFSQILTRFPRSGTARRATARVQALGRGRTEGQ